MTSHPTAIRAHGTAYWIFIGWWWGPIKWLGRVLLWVLLCPVGLWRSIVHHSDTQQGRSRRGAKAGAKRGRKDSKAQRAHELELAKLAAAPNLEQQLRMLDDLLRRGVITVQEHGIRRQALLAQP